MPNYADLKTEAERKRLEARINEIYKETHEELSLRYEEYMDEYKERYKKELAAYKRGEYTKEQFLAWEQTQLARGEKWKKMRDDVADRLTKANQMAADYINGKTPDVFMLNANYTAYEIEKASGIAFDIYSEETIERLIRDNPNILPPARVNAKIDKKWNMDNLQRELASAILQGKSIDELASAFQHTENMDRVAAIRHARTAMAGAQNGGRQLMLEKATEEGVKSKKMWMSTLDGRTRDSHQRLDGETVGVKETFSNGCAYPGDPSGHPKEVYNCRCALGYEIIGFESTDRKRILKNEKGRNDYERKITYTGRNNTKSYKEWLRRKLQEKEREYNVPYGEYAINTEKEYFESEEFVNKFANMTDNEEINKIIAEYARKAVVENLGTLKESMYLIDLENGELISEISDSKYKIDSGISYPKYFKEALQKAQKENKKILSIHNHPEGYPPSPDDFKKSYENKYYDSLAIGANGQVYNYKNKDIILNQKNCDAIQEEISFRVRAGNDIDRANNEVYKAIGLGYNILK